MLINKVFRSQNEWIEFSSGYREEIVEVKIPLWDGENQKWISTSVIVNKNELKHAVESIS